MYTFTTGTTYYTELATTTVFVTRDREGYWLQVRDDKAAYTSLTKEVICTDMIELLDGLLDAGVQSDATWTVAQV
jgi:hypothetical protein